MRRLSLNGLIIAAAAAAAALILSVVRPSPEGLIRFGLGDREVRAAPGQSVQAANAKHDLTALDIFNHTLVRIRDAYVDPTRIDPKQMLYSALDSVQFNIPEVLVEPYPERDEIIVVVNDKKQKFTTKGVDSPWRLSGTLKKVFRFIEAHMNAGADLAQVEYAAINGMLNTLDPHSVLLDPETAREMDVNTSGAFGGLGILIGMRNQKLTVLRPIKGTPAHRAGLKRGDHIVKINDEVTEHLTTNEAVERMRGAPKTSITIWVERKGTDKLLRFDIVRDVIRVDSVQSRMLDKKVGYIRIESFSGRTVEEVEEAMSTLSAQGARGWLLDLRWNPGGLLEQAIKVTDLFVDKGTIVTTVGGRNREPRRARRRGTNTLPVAVLVNGSSASASEIVTGALKNLDRAVVIGSSTFGKGSVQVLYDNKDGSKLKLTIAEYLTPGEQSIQSLGIIPDIAIQRMLVPEKNEGPTDYLRLLPASRTYREKDLRAHLTSRYARDTEKPVHELSYVYDPPKRDTEAQNGDAPLDEVGPADEFVEDFEIKFARDLVSKSSSGSRDKMLVYAKKLIAQRRIAEAAKTSKRLGKLGIDWSAPESSRKPQSPPVLEARITADKSQYNAGDVAKLTGVVTNRGSVPAYQVGARIKSDDPAFEDTELVFGRIAPGQTRTWTAQVQIPKQSRDRVDELSFRFREAQGGHAQAAPVALRIVAAERPVFAYSHQLVDEGNGDGLVQKGERHRLRVTIKNIGAGTAAETAALLRNASGNGVLLRKARFEIGELKPNQSRTVDFVFNVKSALQAEEVVVEMTVYDGALHESVGEKLRYPVRNASAGPASASGYVQIARNATPVYEGASADSGRVASAPRGGVFRLTGKQGPWYRVELEPNRPGFVAATSVRKTNARPRKIKLDTNWQVTPPTISLNIPTYVTDSPTYSLKGQATDDSHVEDVYIFVSNYADRVENRKVFYKSNRNGDKSDALGFQTDVPLWPGTNRVTVVARENDAVKSSHTMFVYRRQESTTAAAPVRGR